MWVCSSDQVYFSDKSRYGGAHGYSFGGSVSLGLVGEVVLVQYRFQESADLVGEGSVVVFVQLGSSIHEGFMNRNVDIEIFCVQCDELVAVFQCNFVYTWLFIIPS